jgi:hypothetical protein
MKCGMQTYFFSCFLCFQEQSLDHSQKDPGSGKIHPGSGYPIQVEILRLFRQGCGSGSGLYADLVALWIRIRIGNPDPGSGSVLGIRIPDPDPGARKLRNFSRKMHFLVFKKKVTTK